MAASRTGQRRFRKLICNVRANWKGNQLLLSVSETIAVRLLPRAAKQPFQNGVCVVFCLRGYFNPEGYASRAILREIHWQVACTRPLPFRCILPFPFKRDRQNVIERGGILPVPLGIVVQLGLAFRREMDFHAPKVGCRSLSARVHRAPNTDQKTTIWQRRPNYFTFTGKPLRSRSVTARCSSWRRADDRHHLI